jgi:hypothetical protein
MIDLDVDIPAGRLQDFLGLAVKTEPPVLTSVIGAKAKRVRDINVDGQAANERDAQ